MKNKKSNQQANVKREAYISLDQEEMGKLRQLSWRERWLYLEMKWLANFKTGEIGTFMRQCITYEQLAGMIGKPTGQGREPENFDGKEAARSLIRMHKAGLIGEIGRRENGGLRFTLPLSPIDQDAARKARQDAASRQMLPDANTVQPAVKPDVAGDCTDSSGLQSVLTTSNNINTFNTDGSDGAGDTPAPASVGNDPTPGFLENPTPGAFSIARIKWRLHEAWFAYVDTADSERFYANWLSQGFNETEFEEAIEQVQQDDSPTPAALDRILRKRRVQKAQPKSRRGRVAL